MNRIIYIAFFNLALIPFLTLGLLAVLPTGSAWVFRVLALLILAGANLAFLRLSIFKEKFRPPALIGRGQGVGLWFPLALGAIGTALILYRASYEPYGWWDSWAMWNAKGRDYSLAFLEGLPFDLIRFHWVSYEYVTFYPAQLAFFAILFGGWHVAVPVGLNLLYYWLIVLLLYDASDRRGAVLARLVLLAGALLPFIINIAGDQSADLAQATVYAYCFYLYFRFRRPEETPGEVARSGPDPSIAAQLCFFIPALALIKTEGAIMALSLAVLWLLDRRRGRLTPLALAGGILPVVFYIYYKLSAGEMHHLAGQTVQLSAMLSDTERYRMLLARFFEFHVLLVLGLPLVLSIATIVDRPATILFLVPLALALVVYHAIFLITPIEQGFHMDTAYTRITTQLYPAFFLVILLAGRGRDAAGDSIDAG